MAVTAQFLKNIMTEARPIIERQMSDAKLIAGFRTIVASNGGDWGALKALIKAHVEDENDETGAGKRVQKIVDKADDTAAYADMLGLANMNEKNFSAGSSSGRIAEFDSVDVGSNPAPATIDPLTGEIHDTQDQPETATGSGRTAQVCGEGMAPPLPAGAADAVCSTPAASVSDAIARKDHQSVSPSSPDGSASTESAAGKVSKLAQPSPPKQAEPIKAGEGTPPPVPSPANLSDEEVVPAFMKDKPGCLKLRDGHCKIGFATEALCAECADKRARAMA
mgnify:CR=1 FL=1